MSELVLFWLIFVASLLVLVKASDFFTDSAEKIGLSVGLPPFIIGVTIVSIGTSLPELISSIIAVMEGSSE
ncbi:MAG: sodium:calcium antiporter, partial [Spirulinaceae cyanobacterium]